MDQHIRTRAQASIQVKLAPRPKMARVRPIVRHDSIIEIRNRISGERSIKNCSKNKFTIFSSFLLHGSAPDCNAVSKSGPSPDHVQLF